MILIAIGLLGFLSIRVVYMTINRNRDRKMANWTESDFAQENQSTERRGDQKLTFRYGY